MRRLSFVLLLMAPAPLLAGFTVRLKTPAREVPVEAELQGGAIMLDLVEAAEGLGAKVSIKDGEYQLEFASGTAVLNPDSAIYRVRAAGERKWRGSGLDVRPYYSGPRLMVAMDALPLLTFRTFTYHLQKKELTEDAALPRGELARDKKAVTVRHVSSGQKDWISLDDAAQGMGVVLFSGQAGGYNLVLPDFTILEVTVGDTWINRKRARYKLLDDPILLFSGAPYATPAALSALFGVEVVWDPVSGALVVPVRYGRFSDVKAAERKPITVVGYSPHPLKLSVDEMSLYYQNPGPTYTEDQPNVYESVRDFLTNRPINPGTAGYDRMSGQAVLNLDGSAGGRPLEGGGRFEKTGTRGRVASGDLRWGFPGLRVTGAREYVKMGDFSGQFGLMDDVSVSHASDAFGEGKGNASWEGKAFYGQHLFSLFISTDVLSQAVDFRQTMVGGALEGSWKPAAGHALTASLAQYRFTNHVRQTSVEFNLFGDPFLDSFIVELGQAKSKALTSTVLTPRHDTTVLDATYRMDKYFSVGADAAVSRFKEPDAGKADMDGDWHLSATLGDRGSRLSGSYERVGPRYRSIGSPLLYQDRSITRLSPYLDLAKFWKVYGEFRREDFHGRSEAAGLSPYRGDFIYLTNTFNFPGFNLRALASDSDNSLYGKRWSGDLDFTKYIGRDSLDAGGAWASQWYSVGGVFKQSYTGRLGYQVLRPTRKLSVGEDLTRNHYPQLLSAPADRWQSATHVLAQAGSWEAFFDYSFEPRYFNDPQVIYTGYTRVGYQVGKHKIFNLFYAATSLERGLKHPQVWRTGIEYVNDFF